MSKPSLVTIGEILERYRDTLDPTTRYMLKLRAKGYLYQGWLTYIAAEYRWLRIGGHPLWQIAVRLPYYAIRFLFR